ncbi:hypothetical protein HXX01_00535 [Candidatus Nomurabacteria bacterium]|nr:hypothetical protein [Candidatus Nomurabacteria bacterium]
MDNIGRVIDRNVNHLGKSLADTSSWNWSDISGSPGNSDYANCRNKTGFTARSAGFRASDGKFMWLGKIGFWWELDTVGFGSHASCLINYGLGLDTYGWHNEEDGLSVRCVKDN